MEKKRFNLNLIDYAPLYVALESAPDGSLWRIDAAEQKPQTGSELRLYFIASGMNAAILEYAGPTMTTLTEVQLQQEVERLRQIQDAAAKLSEDIEKHLAFRRSVPG